jgi:hypothetical protein
MAAPMPREAPVTSATLRVAAEDIRSSPCFVVGASHSIMSGLRRRRHGPVGDSFHASGEEGLTTGDDGMAHRRRHQHRIARMGDCGIHQHAVAAEFHRHGGIGRGADAGIDDDRHAGFGDDDLQVPRIQDAHAGTDQTGQRHDGDTSHALEHARLYGIVRAIDHDAEALADQRLGSAQGFRHVGEQRLLIAQHFELDQIVTIEQFARQTQRAHGLLGRVAARRIGQQGIAPGRQHVEQARLAIAGDERRAADRHGDDVGCAGIECARRFRQVAILPGPHQQAGGEAQAADIERIGQPGIERCIHINLLRRQRRSRCGHRPAALCDRLRCAARFRRCVRSRCGARAATCGPADRPPTRRRRAVRPVRSA